MNDRMTTIYNLMILYMINKSLLPLSNTEIMTFFLEYNYTDYFNVQQTIHNLIDSGNILGIKKGKTTNYYITNDGKEVLEQLNIYLPPIIIEDINKYIDNVYKKY